MTPASTPTPPSAPQVCPTEPPFRLLFRGLREATDHSQESLSVAAGYSRGYVSRIEQGDRIPTLTSLMDFLTALQPSDDAQRAVVVAWMKENNCGLFG